MQMLGSIWQSAPTVLYVCCDVRVAPVGRIEQPGDNYIRRPVKVGPIVPAIISDTHALSCGDAIECWRVTSVVNCWLCNLAWPSRATCSTRTASNCW